MDYALEAGFDEVGSVSAPSTNFLFASWPDQRASRGDNGAYTCDTRDMLG
jgi:hypothetical protein